MLTSNSLIHRYPASPPTISVSTRYPHANIVEEGGHITLCLDMLETPSAKNKSTPYSGWSSAMCVYDGQPHRAGFTWHCEWEHQDGWLGGQPG